MSLKDPPLFAPEEDDVGRQDYDLWRKELHKLIAQFADKHDLSFAMMSLLLVDLGVNSRMIDYLISVERPSGSGLRLELDRFHREIADFLRSSKKTADEFVKVTGKALAEAVATPPSDPDRGPTTG
jgi:hypothetical protein